MDGNLMALLSAWRANPDIAGNIIEWKTVPTRTARVGPLPDDLSPELRHALIHNGIDQLYLHQIQSWERITGGENVVISTGTASGKTLCYQLPALERICRNPDTRALFLFPTKALAQDQQQSLVRLVSGMRIANTAESILVGAYDGDTPVDRRTILRRQARIIISNPDMLHTGILPHHNLWEDFFRSLEIVVLDEVHTYRGVFGSHVANLIRRLKRVAAFYGGRPQFVMTSATISNPVELCERLVEAPVTLIDEDGAPHGPRHFIMYNPPIVERTLGIRKSVLLESVKLADDLTSRHIQTILFGRSRRTVELLLNYLRSDTLGDPQRVRGYRSGYLPAERREIERGLRDGSVTAVVATTALELGIDIGSMDAAVLVGYPGTIAATQQQSGRAGRKSGPSLAVLVTSAAPIDQYLAHHPEFLFERTPERALINPDNLLILLKHLRCAAFELPFRQGERFGDLPADQVAQFLDLLVEGGELHASGERYFWMADKYPADSVSLRSASPQTVLLQAGSQDAWRTIGEVDLESAVWMAHPQAVYLHDGESYLVEDLDLEHYVAHLRRVDTDYYTEPREESRVECICVAEQAAATGCTREYGEILVTTQVTGFRKIRWYTHENLGAGQVSLPPSELRTTGYWLALDEATVSSLRDQGLWTNDANDYGPNWPVQRDRARARDGYHCQICGIEEKGRAHHVHHKMPFRTFPSYEIANQLDNLVTLCPNCHRLAETAVRMRSGLAGLAYVLGQMAPLFLMCDSRDLGVHSDPQSPLGDGKPTVVVYDQVPAGIGLSERLYQLHAELIASALERVQECECNDGCPACVGPAGESGAGGKAETLALLKALAGVSSDKFALMEPPEV